MRTLEQVDRDIEIVKYDMHELMKMRQPISIVGEELVDLYEERREILKANKRAHWVFGSTMGHNWMKCSNCLVSQIGQTATFSYCPNCGVEMSEPIEYEEQKGD